MADVAERPIRTGNAAAALLVREDGHYILQRRDDIPGIWYPGHWGLFGGGVDAGEDEVAALRRELREEIELDLRAAKLFVRLSYDLTPVNLRNNIRSYFEVPVSFGEYDRLVLHEGAGMQAFGGPAALSLTPIVPFDSFAIFLHHNRTRLA